jgi:uncharacterized protein YndB with AHSA1/START domain
MINSRHVSTVIAAPPDVVYTYASDPATLPTWAAGLAGGVVEHRGDHWATASPLGQIEIRFEGTNSLGVLDHWVTMPSGEVVYNPMRVLAHDDGCEIVFTVRQRTRSDDELAADVAAVETDLRTLKRIVEESTK